MKADAIIQARLGATRLPGKVLLKIMGKTILEYVVERVRKAGTIGKIIVATTIEKEDSQIADLVNGMGVNLYRGSKDDVLDRFYNAAKSHKVRHMVRITADCPLIDPEIIDRVVDSYHQSGADYCSNTLVETFPDGEDVEVFNYRALSEAWAAARLVSEREHVTPYIRKNPNRFKLLNVQNDTNLYGKRWTLDTKEDFEFIKAVLESVYPVNPDFHMKDVLDFLGRNPSVEEHNKAIIRNEGYLKSLKEDTVFKTGAGRE